MFNKLLSTPVFIICLAVLACSDDDGEVLLFEPGNGATDVDGNSYQSIVLGGQEWMASNLRATKYSNGDLIENVPGDTWGGLSSGAWCYYNNDELMNGDYGKLYNWYAISDARKICPVGWHVPDDFDWAKLITYLGGSDDAGGKMKETGTLHWNLPNTGATNTSGFNGIPGGDRRGALNSVFETFGTLGRHWSSSQLNVDEAWGYDLLNDEEGIGRNEFNKHYGFSCRCVRD